VTAANATPVQSFRLFGRFMGIPLLPNSVIIE
jgi:hypothetical protein